MNRSKKSISPIEEKPSEIKYNFSKMFDVKFDALIKAFSDTLDSLNKMSSGKIDCDYGVCSTSYNIRYITPKNISTFVDNLLRAVEGNFFKDNMNDVEMFIVASVQKFFEENGCGKLEDASTLSESDDTVNPQAWTLDDLEKICSNDMGTVAVYSKGEIVQRIKFMNEDLKKIKEMHFAANAKKLSKALPKIINDSCVYSMATMKAIFKAIEDFLLFAVTVNTCTVLQMYAYCNPATDYKFKKEKKEDSDEENVVTECCMCKTNDYMIRNRIPFNCNMRDVILQDVTPDFKDTHDALHFILKDSRSPISILVNKYASKEGIREIHQYGIARMFLGVNKCHEHCLDEVFKKDCEPESGDPLKDVADFKTKVDWLDNIAFGNNYLDGNYRRDALGNNHVHPITNSLDMIFKIYGGIELKSNEELADNILSVAGAIKSIIHEYNEGAPIENYDLTKDILVLFGEILTRNMLRLYYNNTQVIVFRDDMPNAGAPGFIEESFMMEELGEFIQEEATDGTGSDTGNKGKEDGYKGVSFTDGNGNAIKQADTGKIKKLLNSIINWFKSVFEKWTKSAVEKLGKYKEEVEKNKDLNAEIGNALGNSFHANLKNYKKFVINVEKFSGGLDIAKDYVNRWMGDVPISNFAKTAVIMLGIKDDAAENIVTAENNPDGKPNWKAIADKCVEHYFFNSTSDSERYFTGELTKDMWEKDVIGDIIGAPDTVDKCAKAFSNKGEEIKKLLDNKLNEQNINDTTKKKVETLTEAYKQAYTELTKKIVTSLATVWIKDRYGLWKTVTNNFSTQKSTASTNNTTEQKPAEQTQEAKTEAINEQPLTVEAARARFESPDVDVI